MFDRRAFLKVGSLRVFGLLGYGDFLRLRAQAALNDPDPGVREAANEVLRAEGRGQRAEKPH